MSRLDAAFGRNHKFATQIVRFRSRRQLAQFHHFFLAEDKTIASGSSHGRRRNVTGGKWALPAGLLLAVLLAWSLYGLGLLAGIGQYLVIDEAPSPADVIVATYSSHSVAGAEKVVELYGAGLANNVLLSSIRISVAGVDANETAPLVRRYLIAQGVPEAAIYQVDTLPTSEHEETEAVQRAMESNSWGSALIVVVDSRSRRTMATMRAQIRDPDIRLVSQVFKSEIGDSEALDLSHWWETRQGVNALLNEYPRLIYYFIRGRL